MLVAVDDDVCFAALSGDGDRHQFVCVLARLVRGHRAVVGPHRQLVLRFARDAVGGTEILRRLDHAAGHRV
jgi:hypothetical protein